MKKDRKLSEYISKHEKIIEKNLKYDFLPQMLEIIEKPENKLSDIIIIMILALILSAVIWASIAKVDMVVTSTGNVMPEGNLVSVINAYGGEVESVDVKDGDFVKKGQVIMSINSESEEASLEELEYQLSILKCQKDVYEKIRDYNEEDSKLSADEEQLPFNIDAKSYKENESVAQAIIAEQELYLINCKEYDIERKRSDFKESVDNQKNAYVAQRNLDIMQNINSLEVKIRETEKNIEDTKRTISEKEIKAPTDGVLSNLSVNSEGIILPSGQNVCYIIPEDSESRFIAYVKTSDIEGVHIGDEVRIRLSSLNDTEYERMNGIVEKVGDLAINSEGMGSVYKVEVKIEEIPEELLKVGVDGTCDIIIGKRTVLMYFMEPFIDGLRDSFHEK